MILPCILEFTKTLNISLYLYVLVIAKILKDE